MRDHVERARDHGMSLGFFSANTSCWQVRYEPSVATISRPDPGRLQEVVARGPDHARLPEDEPVPARAGEPAGRRDDRRDVHDAGEAVLHGRGRVVLGFHRYRTAERRSLTNPDGTPFLGTKWTRWAGLAGERAAARPLAGDPGRPRTFPT